MQDRPTAVELLEAVREFLEEEIAPTVTDRRTRFRALVAVNAIRILQREAAEEEAHVREEADALRTLLRAETALPESAEALRGVVLELNAELAARIRGGRPPAGTVDHLRRVADAKLSVASPEYLRRYET